jgi:DNA-binding PadR family transcriptional regulator
MSATCGRWIMSVRLFVLGVLNEQDTHGYEIKEIARAWNLDKWADIGYGSIYHALGALEDEELIQEVRVEQEGGRPPRSVYRITDRGRQAFLQLLRETSRYGYQRKHPINLALTFIAHLPPEERVSLLEERLRRLEDAHQRVTEQREKLRHLEAEAPWVIATLNHDLGHLEFEIDWTRDLLRQAAHWAPRPPVPPEPPEL